MACASRFHYARHTIQHLESKGFPNIMWLRTPETSDIHGLDPENNYRRRLMIMYYTTVLPAVRRLAEEEKIDGVYIIEDSCILAPNVTYVQVAKETEGCEAGIFGYAHHEKNKQDVWFGTKGMYFSTLWCEQLQIILQNTHTCRVLHIWTTGLPNKGKTPKRNSSNACIPWQDVDTENQHFKTIPRSVSAVPGCQHHQMRPICLRRSCRRSL